MKRVVNMRKQRRRQLSIFLKGYLLRVRRKGCLMPLLNPLRGIFNHPLGNIHSSMLINFGYSTLYIIADGTDISGISGETI